MTELKYNTTIRELNYTNDIEYRQTLRTLFGMSSKTEDDFLEEIDEITQDELDFDSEATEVIMNEIFDKTKTHILFQKLYGEAAAKMISLDHSIGLAVLCSYDYLSFFHKCLCIYFDSPDSFTVTCPEYLQLLQKLGAR